MHSSEMLQTTWTEAQAIKVQIFQGKDWVFGAQCLIKGVWPSGDYLKVITKYPEPTKYTAKGFIRLVRHYRCFIKDFAKIMALCMNMREVTQPRKRKKGWS